MVLNGHSEANPKVVQVTRHVFTQGLFDLDVQGTRNGDVGEDVIEAPRGVIKKKSDQQDHGAGPHREAEQDLHFSCARQDFLFLGLQAGRAASEVNRERKVAGGGVARIPARLDRDEVAGLASQVQPIQSSFSALSLSLCKKKIAGSGDWD